MSARIWALLVLLSLLWGGSFFFVEVALVRVPPLTLALLRVTFLIPVTAIALGTLILGERIAPHSLAGMAIIFTALAVTDGRLFSAWKAARSMGS